MISKETWKEGISDFVDIIAPTDDVMLLGSDTSAAKLMIQFHIQGQEIWRVLLSVFKILYPWSFTVFFTRYFCKNTTTNKVHLDYYRAITHCYMYNQSYVSTRMKSLGMRFDFSFGSIDDQISHLSFFEMDYKAQE